MMTYKELKHTMTHTVDPADFHFGFHVLDRITTLEHMRYKASAKELEAIDLAVAALWMRIPSEPIPVKSDEGHIYGGDCPSCGKFVATDELSCEWCGQLLNWGDIDEQ